MTLLCTHSLLIPLLSLHTPPPNNSPFPPPLTLTSPPLPLVLLVVSSTAKDPVEDFAQLDTKQKQSETSKYPKWLSPHIYYYHVLLHDVMDGAADMAR